MIKCKIPRLLPTACPGALEREIRTLIRELRIQETTRSGVVSRGAERLCDKNWGEHRNVRSGRRQRPGEGVDDFVRDFERLFEDSKLRSSS